MKKYINLIFGIIGILIIVRTFLNGMEIKEVFGFKMNIWIYRLIWGFIAISSFVDFYYKKRKTN